MSSSNLSCYETNAITKVETIEKVRYEADEMYEHAVKSLCLSKAKCTEAETKVTTDAKKMSDLEAQVSSLTQNHNESIKNSDE